MCEKQRQLVPHNQENYVKHHGYWAAGYYKREPVVN
jgi:hypothetical protein